MGLPRDSVGVSSSAARMPSVGSSTLVVLSYCRLSGKAGQVVVAGDPLLQDQFLLAGDAEAAGPVLGQFAVQRDLFQQRGLVVGLQGLLDGVEVEFKLLVAGEEVGLDELRADLIAGSDDGVAAGLVGGGQVQLFSVAEQVAVVPAGGEVDAEVGRVADADIDRVQRTFGEVEGDRQLALRVERVGGFGADHREDADARTGPDGRSRSTCGLNGSPWWSSRRWRTKDSFMSFRPVKAIGPISAFGPISGRNSTSSTFWSGCRVAMGTGTCASG